MKMNAANWRRARRAFLRTLVLVRRASESLGLRPYFSLVTWPRTIWALVVFLILAYLMQDRSIPQPGEGEIADLDCLALNIYFEARSEPLDGKRAVGHVVLNRVRDTEFPESVCQVVRQGGENVRHGCQFSWWCDGRSDRPVDTLAWRESREVAWEVLRGATKDPTSGALWYHAEYVQPSWQDKMLKSRRIGQHIFYRRP
jgi:spore germination cell wall hydrolase CwlJ-like protein